MVLCISADLPFAQSRFCGAEGLSNVVTLSTLRAPQFRQIMALLSPQARWLVWLHAQSLLSMKTTVVYSQLVNEITEEPDYDAALAALKA